ncbi:type II secretion system protein [Candidatus Saccharibacteria bacterium]|nr:type II secretion system protein [Candidatus Saccharibacteria bacterium]
MKKFRGGFTIVEILIVVVTITILVAITVVVYGSAQQRARNAQTALAVRSYKDVMQLYWRDNGKYPDPTVAGTSPCLGSNYSGGCWFTSGVVDTALMTTLKNTIGGKVLPMPAMPNVPLKGIMYVPIGSVRVDGASFATATSVAMLVYSVEGSSTPCPVGPVASKPSNGNALWFSATPPTTRQTYMDTNSNLVQCWIILP